MKRFLKLCIGLFLTIALICAVRLYFVQQDIKNRPVEISDLADAGYVPEGDFGHGTLGLEGGEYGWYIYDEPTPDGRVKKVCANGKPPQPHMDIDFVYFDSSWYKLRSGTFFLGADGKRIEPPTYKWKGILSSKTAFAVDRPDWPYRLKIIIGKLRHSSLSPREYVQGLKLSNASCSNIPSP